MVLALITATAAFAPTVVFGESPRAHPAVTVRPSLELGFVDIPHNVIRYGRGTDTFDYVTQGGQEVLFPYSRFRVDIGIGERQRHFVGLLYQPLTFETVTQFEKTMTIDTETFEEGQVVNLVYGFDFWRGTYEYRILDGEPWTVDAGGSLQIRNASIRFRAQEGDELVISQGTGIVPALRAQARYTTDSRFWVEAEADGFYATNAFINGAEYPFTGWIWDTALSAGVPVTEYAETYLSVRTIGGGATGTATDPRETWTESAAGGDERYTKNELTTVAFSVGVRLLF